MTETDKRLGDKMSRRRFVRGAALGVAALSLLAARGGAASAQATADPDALHRRIRAELRTFTDWLKRNGVKGYIGEVGWPDDVLGDQARWNALAQAWFKDADAANLWVTVWSTGEWWGTQYRLAAYEDRRAGPGVDSANTQAPVVEAHPSTRNYLRGVAVTGAEFGTPGPLDKTSKFSNKNPGVYDYDYHYDSQETFDYLAGRGIKLVRLAFRWERLQPSLGRALRQAELRRLKGAVARARTAGLKVVLDMHSYGAYYLSDGTRGVRRPIGSAQVTRDHFADVWRRISAAFKGGPGVVGYGLMNEPVAMPSSATMSSAEGWELASQKALNAIRKGGDGKLVLVSGYRYAGVQRWPGQHPDKWIRDNAHNHRYEGHHYWDRDNSGAYLNSYAAEVANARQRGY